MSRAKSLLASLTFAAGVSGVLLAPTALADAAVATMAGIVMTLQHFPSDADKATLATIAGSDASASVKAVANAIAAIRHSVSADDRATLEAIAADQAEPDDLRALARVVAGINHMPSADDKAALMALTGS